MPIYEYHCESCDVDFERLKWLDELMASVPKGSWMLLPLGVWVLILMAVVVALLLRYTRLGRHIFAVGSNEETARLCGVAVWRVKVMVFTLCGAFAGLAGVLPRRGYSVRPATGQLLSGMPSQPDATE